MYVDEMTTTPKNLITRAEAAVRAGVDPRTIDNWRQAGLLTTYSKRGGRGEPRVLIDPAQLDKITAPQPVPAQRSGS